MEDRLTKHFVKNKLRFPADLEKQFDEDYFERTLTITRIALVLAFILYAAFGLLDVFISPVTKHFTWLIRYAVVCPVIISVLILSYFEVFRKVVQFSVSLVSLFAGLGIVAMIVTSQSVEGSLYYYAGLTLVIMWSYTFVRLKFINATVVCWIIVLAYEFSIIYFKGLGSSDQLINAFINNNFFFISSNIIGMFVCFHMEMYTRQDFLQRLIILENHKKIEEEKNILAEWRRIMNIELDMARTIQQQIIPEDNPSKDISALFKPMEPIGGDFYDFIKFREPGTVGIFISDVSGHGVPAALITTMIKSLISGAGSTKLNPAQLLESLNETLVNQTGKNHVTAFYGIYNKIERTIVYSCAGHNPPYIIYNNKITEMNKARSIPLGIINIDDLRLMNKAYSNHTEILPAGSKLLFYTDGLTEARKPDKGESFFEDVMGEIVLGLAELSSKEFIETLYRELVSFSGGEQFDDDVCIICVDVE